MTGRKNNLKNHDKPISLHTDSCVKSLTEDHVTRRDALRSVTKTMAIGTLGLASLGSTAGAFEGHQHASDIKALDKSHWVSGHDGVLVFVDDWDGVPRQDMRAVTFLNTSEYPITLDHVNPGLLRTENQVFNLNHILAQGPITLMPEETRSFGLFPVNIGNLDYLIPAHLDTVGTLVQCTPHTVAMDGWKQMTQYAVIA